jgi:mono/diheme cytochrome c family protein
VGRFLRLPFILGPALAFGLILVVHEGHPSQMGGTPRGDPESSSQDVRLTPPLDLKDEVVIKEGSTIFSTTCSYCHKDHESGGGDAGVPTLRDRPYDKEYLFKTISNGPPSRRMPAWKYQYSSDQIWKLVAYILSINRTGGG